MRGGGAAIANVERQQIQGWGSGWGRRVARAPASPRRTGWAEGGRPRPGTDRSCCRGPWARHYLRESGRSRA
eukprot:3812186-Pyramimonas_sp.AAC.1